MKQHGPIGSAAHGMPCRILIMMLRGQDHSVLRQKTLDPMMVRCYKHGWEGEWAIAGSPCGMPCRILMMVLQDRKDHLRG
jgi:hypothetical protein